MFKITLEALERVSFLLYKKELITMFPNAFIEPISERTENETTDNGIDFLFDYESGQHIMNGSVLRECTELQKVRQYIQNVLRTQADLYKVYTEGETNVFGLSIYNYLGERSLPLGYINSELKREVTGQLLKHPMINDVKDWTAKREKQGLNVSFTAVLTDGDIITTTETVTGYV